MAASARLFLRSPLAQDGGLDYWALNGDRNTVLFDMTWGTNML